MAKIYLIRHGETDSNKAKQFQGRIDMPLNEAGIAQAKAMAQFMADKKIDAIYTSSMKRACMTAAELAAVQGIDYKPLDSLREVSFGDWEGLGYAEINERWPEEMNAFLTRPGEWIPPNGESFHDAKERTDKALADILAEAGDDKNIAIVSHGGIIRVQLCSLLGVPLNNLWKFSVFNTSVTTLANWQGSIIAETINDANFLKTLK